VVDEAAQLKECESAIPLQLNGLKRYILIGDERQLNFLLWLKARYVENCCLTLLED
jgi:superfamily I DNA and/or RNA helicase